MWIKIDDDFPQHPKVVRAGPLGIALHVAAICYCNRLLTDGFVPKQVASTLLDFSGLGMRMWDGDVMGGGHDANWLMVVDDLVLAGLWVEKPDGWIIYNYLKHQSSKAHITEIREVRKAAGKKGGEAKHKQLAPGLPSVCLSKTEAKPKQKKSKSKISENTSTNVDTPSPSDDGSDPDSKLLDFPPSLKRKQDAEEMFQVWNRIVPLPASKLTVSRCQKLTARLKQEFGNSIEAWTAYCVGIAATPFLLGENDKGWKAGIDWALEPRNVIKVLEGQYERARTGGEPSLIDTIDRIGADDN